MRAARFKRNRTCDRVANQRAILADVTGGLVAATTCLPFSIANGALIYSGTFQPMLVAGIAAGLLTTAIAAIVLALTSTFRPVVATANSTTAAPLGAIMVSLSPALAHLPPAAAAATVFALVAVATIATAWFSWVSARRGLGRSSASFRSRSSPGSWA